MRWLSNPSEACLREALSAAVPALADAAVELPAQLAQLEAEWCAATAIVGGRFIAKFAWSEPAAIRVQREAEVLQALVRAAPALPVPAVEAASDDPVLFVTRRVEGRPLRFVHAHVTPSERAAVACELGRFLATLHQPAVLVRVSEAAPALIQPQPQGATPAIRERLPRFLDRPRAQRVSVLCDWVDEILGQPAPPPVLAHGDFHGFNQVWDQGAWTLRLVADFEVAGPADREYDFRYLPPLERTFGLVTATHDQYVAHGGGPLDLQRVMAWHIRTALGDALWRSEAGVPLPGDSTPASYIDDIGRKFPLVRAMQ
jgi:aminoglycoside phosphotransferase (APT) family kinase protein